MPKIVRKRKDAKAKSVIPEKYTLPITRRARVVDIWRYAYMISGEKKIGKTSLAIEGAEELVIQFDKPQISYDVREENPKNWKQFMRILVALEAAAEESDFPYNRIVIDGLGEWYSLCQSHVCKQLGVESLGDAKWGAGWTKMRDEFTDAVNRLLSLQVTAKCGVLFIAHAEWKEVDTRDNGKVTRLTPSVPSRCEEIVGGKVDGWFMYDYAGKDRVLVIQGSETISAGHRIDGQFLTPDGRRVREIVMGNSAAEALENFQTAFNNKQTYTTYKELRDKEKGDDGRKSRKVRKK